MLASSGSSQVRVTASWAAAPDRPVGLAGRPAGGPGVVGGGGGSGRGGGGGGRGGGCHAAPAGPGVAVETGPDLYLVVGPFGQPGDGHAGGGGVGVPVRVAGGAEPLADGLPGDPVVLGPCGVCVPAHVDLAGVGPGRRGESGDRRFLRIALRPCGRARGQHGDDDGCRDEAGGDEPPLFGKRVCQLHLCIFILTLAGPPEVRGGPACWLVVLVRDLAYRTIFRPP